MITWSDQHKIVSNITTSFGALKINKNYSTAKDLLKDQIFLRSSKYETTPKSDFVFIVLWLVFSRNLNKIETFQTLQALPVEEKNYILAQKTQFITYLNVFNKDQITVKTQNKNEIYSLYIKKEISLFYFYYFFRRNPPTKRIPLNKFKKINLLLDFFPVIKEYLDSF